MVMLFDCNSLNILLCDIKNWVFKIVGLINNFSDYIRDVCFVDEWLLIIVIN